MSQKIHSLFLIFLAVILFGCAPLGAQSFSAGQATSGPTLPAGQAGQGSATAYPRPVIQATGIASGGATVYPGPAATPDASGDGSVKTVTLEQNRQTISLHQGETFLLKLGEIYQWNIVIDHPEVISRIPNIAVVRGAQGVYRAIQAGTATLSADGDPLCRQSKPACMMPSIRFSVQVEVLP